MLKKKVGELEWLEFALLQPFPEVAHGVFLRSLDMAGADAKVLQKELISLLGFSAIASCEQVHGSSVVIADAGKREKGDALITRKEGLALQIQHADCQATILYDPKTKTVANIHCGWRGNVQNIYGQVVSCLEKEYGIRATDLIACISPSLGPEKSEFIHYEVEFPQELWRFKKGACHFDLWALAQWQLEETGIRPNQIEVAGLCTYSDPSSFFSYRRDKKGGRHATVVGLKTCADSLDRIGCA